MKNDLNIITVKNLTFSYFNEDEPDIKSISLSVPRSKYTTIIGCNGSGKSTLSKLLCAILKGNLGEIFIDGILVSRNNLNLIRQKIGVIFQNPDNQFIGSTVYDDIEFGLQNYNIPADKIDKIINKSAKMVGISDILDQEPTSLSGGQKQRVAVASIFSLEPKIIIFDESTSMLDPSGKIEILNLMQNLRLVHKKTILSITHDMDEVAYSDNVIFLHKGNVVFEGTPSDLFLNKFKDLKKYSLSYPRAFLISKELNRKNKLIKKTIYDKELIDNLNSIVLKNKKFKPKNKKKDVIEEEVKINFKDVTVFYNHKFPGEKKAIQNVNVSFMEGKINGLIGNTGSGKSTLIQTISMLMQTTEGEIKIKFDNGLFLIKGKKLFKNEKRFRKLKKFRRNIGIIFQFPEYQLFNQTVKKEIMFAPLNFNFDKKKAEKNVKKLLHLVDLDYNYVNQNPFELSGGQKRRVAIASILSYEPEIIIFDEPTAGLDPIGVIKILNILRDLRDKGKTIIMISHDMDNVLNICDRIAILNNGEIIYEGDPTKALFNNNFIKKNKLVQPYVFRFLKQIKSEQCKNWKVKNLEDLILKLRSIV